MDAFSNVHKNFSDNVVRNLFIFFLFAFFIFTPYLKAGTATVDLNVSLSHLGGNKVEANYPFSNLITISNTNSGSNLDATNAKISYTLPSGSSYDSFTGVGWENISLSSSTVTFKYTNSLNNGKTSNVLDIKVKAPSSTSSTITPIVTVLPPDGTSDPNSSNDTENMTLEVGKSNLQASKTASKTPLEIGEQFTYTISISNPDNGSNPTVKARNVTISDTLPSQISFVSLSDTSWCSQSSGTVTCSGVDLDVGTSRSVTITAKASSGGTGIKNTATIHTDSSDYNGNTRSPSATVDVNLADIKLSQALIGGIDSSNAAVNSSVVYRLHVVNSGTSPAQNVTLSDTLPNGVAYNGFSSSGDWTCSGTSTIECTLNDTNLTQNEAYDLDINVTMPSTHGDITNDANISTISAESDTSNNNKSLTTHVKGADLDISKTPDGGNADIGTNYTYTIKVTNNGLATAHNVEVNDTLDSKMSYVSDSIGCGSSLQNCNLGDIDANSNKSFTVTVKMPTDSLDDVINTASATTDTDQQNNINTTDTATTHITGPNLNITKDANVTDVGLGKTFSYTINVSNVNTAFASSADIEDQLPSGVSIISILSNPDNWSCPTSVSAGSTFHCTKATVPGNSSSSITFEAQAPSSVTGAVVNTAKISHSINANDGTDTASVNVTGVVLTIDKVATPIVEAGGLIDYNITVTNTSHSDAQSLTLTDNLTSLGSGYTINSIINSDGWDCNSSTASTLICTRATLLAEGASSTIHFKVNVPYNATLGTKTNTASVTTTTKPQPTVSDSATTTIQGADIVVIPPTTTTAVANENVVFTIGVRNNGNAIAKDVNITNHFNTNATANFTNIKIDCNGGTNYVTVAGNKCQLGDITKNQTKNITISATAPNYDSQFPGNTDVMNGSVAVTSTSQSDATNDNKDWGVEVHGSDIVVYKTSNKAEVAADGTVTYTLSVKNQWEATATNIQLDDNTLGTSHDNFTFINGTLSYTPSDWHCTLSSSTHFTCNYKHDLAQNQTTSSITIQAKAPNTLSAIDNNRDNQAVVTTDTAEKETATTNTVVTPVTIRGADLNITKTVSPNPAKLGESVTYTITVNNSGLADAANAYVDDTLLSGFTNITTTGCINDGSSVTGQAVHCTLGTLAQNASKSFTITANAPNTNGNFLNTATTSSDTLEKDTTNNTGTVTLQVRGADLRPRKSAPAQVAGNSEFTYVISLQNIGLSTAYGAEINDTIPSNNGTSYVSGSLTTMDGDWTCSLNGQDIHCYTNDSNLSIPNGYNKNIASFKVKAGPAHYWIHNTVVAGTNTSEANYANNTYTANTEVINIDLQARKYINNHNYGANENYIGIAGNLEYKLYVRNRPISGTTPPPLTDVNVTDIIPSNVTNVTVTPSSRFTCKKKAFSILSSLSLIGPGDTLFCTMNDGANTPLVASWGYTLVATITTTAPNASHFDINDENNNFVINKYKAETSFSDKNLNNNAPTTGDGYLHTNTLVRGANMSIIKTVSANPVGANQSFSYTLATRNYPRTGTAAHDIPSTIADNIVVKDTLPADVNFTSASGTNWSCSEAGHILTCTYGNSVAPSNSAPPITVNGTAPNSTGEVLSNEANVTNSTPELVRLLPDNTDTVNTTTQGTDITITKTGPSTAGMSDVVTYSVTVNNGSSVPASDIYVLDTFPNGATYDGNISNSHWSLGTDVNGSKKFIYDQNLSGGASTTFTFNSTLPHYTGTARNHVEAFTSTVETSSPNKANWDIAIQGGDIVFASNPTQSPNPVGAYGTHQYFISIKNQGLSDAKDINVTFNFNNMSANPGWSDVNASGTGWSCDPFDTNNLQIICHLPTLSKSSTANPITISSIAPNYNGDITNSVVVVGTDDANNTTGQSKSVTTTIRGADLKITKYAHDPDPLNSDPSYHDDNITVGVGKVVDFKLSVANINLGLAKDITVTDVMPSGFSDFNITNPGDWNCSFASDTLICTRSTLAPNTAANDIFVSAKTSSNIGNVNNVADVNTSTSEVDNSNNNDDVKIKLEGATLNVNLDASKTQVALGEDFTYILDINNTGRNPAIDVNTTDLIPTDINYTDNNGSDTDWTCTQVGNTVSCSQPLIQAYSGESILKLNVKAPTDNIGTYSNSININSNSIENPINTTAPDVRVLGADLGVSLNATPTDVLEDRNVTYTMNVKDMNISTAHNVVLKQTFSQAINALYITSGASDCNLTDSNQSVTCNYSKLDYNQDKNITVVATMPNIDTTTTLTSTTTVTTSTPQEDLVNHTASVDVKVYPIKPVADYRFEECKWDGTSGEVRDSTGTLNATAKNGTQTINHVLAYDKNSFSTAWRSGSFDGSNDYIAIPNNTIINTSSHNKRSISVWFKSTLSNNKNQIIYEEGGGARGLAIYVNNNVLYVSGWNKNESGWNGTYINTPISTNKWYHVVLVLDAEKDTTTVQNNVFKAYLNGAMINQGQGSQLWPHGDAIGIGGVNGGTKITNHTNFKGNIDELEIYNIALDDKAVNDIYNFEKNHKNYDGTDRNETTCGVDLKVVKTAIPSGDVGAESDLSYNITVTNLSNEPVTKGFTLSDSLPADVNYASDTHSSNLLCTGTDNINCTFPNTLIMKKNDSETITVHTTTANVDKQNIMNTATATAVQPDSDINNNSDSASNRIIGTDLKITKTATPTRPNAGSAFIYTVKVENISSLADARNLVITDHYDSRLLYNSIATSTSEANATINCSTLSNHRVSCSMNKLSKGNSVQLFLSMVSPNAATGLINEANVTSETKDTYLTNNSVSISIDTNNSASGVNIIRPSLKLFNNDVSANKYGNIATIGNTMLVPNNYTGTQKLNEINSSLVNSSSAELNLINTDNSNPDDNITIEYAGLFWGGHLHGNDKNETGNNIPFNSVDFTTPDGSVHHITVNKTETNGTIDLHNRADFYHFKKGDDNNDTSNIGNYRIFYGAKADITSIIKDLNSSQLNGTYTVANMSVTSGIDDYDWAPSIKTEGNTTTTSWTRFRNYGYFGGWSMVVAYSINHRYHRGVRFKNLSTFSGFVDLVPPGPGGQAKLPIDISGFITPIHGDIESSLYSFVQGGDRELSLENMTVKDKSGNENFVIEDTNNTTNIFNDTITLRNASGNLISKNPDENYNVGNDIDQYNLNSKYDNSNNCTNSDGRPCYLSNSQDNTKATISVKESDALDGTEYPSEQAFVQMLSMQTQIFTPDFIDSYKECFKLKSPLSPQLGWVPCSDPSPLLRRGDTVKYRLTAINTGDDYANDVYILDNLPREVTYEENSSIVTHILPFDELEANSPCNSSDYEYNETVRDECSEHLKDLIENNATSPLTTVTPIDSNWTDNIDHNYNDINYSDVNNSLVYHFDTFPKNNVVWIEFNTTINGYASLGHTFKNKMSITFTNPTLADYNLSGGTVTQVSLPVESSPVTFNWDNINIVARDIERNSVGAKIVNAPFDLNLTLTGMSELDKADANTSIFLNSLRIIDAYNNTNKDIYPTVVDSNTGIPLSTGIYTWLTHGTTYNRASRKLGFDMNISVKSSDGNYSVSKMFPQDFPNEYNASAPYTGDLFSTRPKEFILGLSGANTASSGVYTIVKSGKTFTVNVSAPDINGSNSLNYNTSLSKGTEISVGLDSSFSTNPACVSQGDLNISALNFNNGAASTNSLTYKNVGVVKVVLKDVNWTAIDNPSDCNTTTIGDNNSSDADGLISCSVDGNSTSIVFEPDHFTYTGTAVNDFNGEGFTYMVLNPIADSMYGTVTTTLEARNSDDNITSFFSNTCFGYDTNVQLSYDATSKGLGDLNVSVANENNITNIASNPAVNNVGNNISTLAYKNQYTGGAAPLTIRMAVDRNTTGLALQPALIDPQNLQGSITGYLGITGADVPAGAGTDINGTNNMHFLFGRVHAPDYRFAGNIGKAKIYYEAYCKDCNQTYRNNMSIIGGESVDSVDWYINTLHNHLNDGNVSSYHPVNAATILSTYSSATVSHGVETITATAPLPLPYIDKVDINATDWLTYDPKDFILEFQRDTDKWAGQGDLGHHIDINVSTRSNRRLNW